MNYSSLPVQLALFSEVLRDPVASIPEVKVAMQQLLAKRWPSGKPRPVVVNNRLFSSITNAAYWLLDDSVYYVKAQTQSPFDLHRVIINLKTLIRNRCDAMDYEWTTRCGFGPEEAIGRPGVWDETWFWPTDDWIDIDNPTDLLGHKIVDYRWFTYNN